MPIAIQLCRRRRSFSTFSRISWAEGTGGRFGAPAAAGFPSPDVFFGGCGSTKSRADPRPLGGLEVHQELGVRLERLELLREELHALGRVHVHEDLAQDPD